MNTRAAVEEKAFSAGEAVSAALARDARRGA